MKFNTENSSPPIFIVGAARSGTTLLQYMLRSHPQISLPTAESHFFIPYYHRRDQFCDLDNIENLKAFLREIYHSRKHFFDDDVHGIRFDIDKIAKILHQKKCITIPDIITGIFQLNAQAEGKTRWGDKTPYYILHLPTLLEMFPNAQIIHLIRDGRDCALSMLERKWDLKIFNTYHAACTWNKYVNAGKAFAAEHANSYHEISYENILNKPESTLQELSNFLHIEFNHKVIDFKKSGGFGKTSLLTKPLQKSNQAKWKQKMSKHQQLIFESVAGETLSKCGYETLYKNTPTLSKTDWFLNESHIKVCFFLSQHFSIK